MFIPYWSFLLFRLLIQEKVNNVFNPDKQIYPVRQLNPYKGLMEKLANSLIVQTLPKKEKCDVKEEW